MPKRESRYSLRKQKIDSTLPRQPAFVVLCQIAAEGSAAFAQSERTRKGLIDKLKVMVDFQLYEYNGQYHERLVVESPGGFPNGITVDNILNRQSPRNRRIAEILSLCGLVERAGQGMNLIYEISIMEAKELPDFTGTDDNFVKCNFKSASM